MRQFTGMFLDLENSNHFKSVIYGLIKCITFYFINKSIECEFQFFHFISFSLQFNLILKQYLQVK